MKVAVLVSCATALLFFVPPGSPLKCYTCLFPTISPLDCFKFITPCGPSQRCLQSVTTGHRGALELVIHEMSCGNPSMCGLRGTRSMLGTNFTYYTTCCSTDLCNKAVRQDLHIFWGLLLASLSFFLVNIS
uniref:UPAR/Ly6 domain-containing protein n=1 Tax=Anolis carolinensis TaxID=28377 RepID=A0A803T9X8_ANOCA